jgi:hypothetical protein
VNSQLCETSIPRLHLPGGTRPFKADVGRVAVAALVIALAGACARKPQATDVLDPAATANVTLALTEAPPSAACLVVTFAANDKIQQAFPLSGTGTQTVAMSVRPGHYVLTVDAFAETCDKVKPDSNAPTWLADPLSVDLRPGHNPLAITLHTVAATDLTVSFDGGMTAVSPGGGTGAACVGNSDCASGNCGGFMAGNSVGACQAPPVVLAPGTPSNVPLVPSKAQLLFSTGDDGNCHGKSAIRLLVMPPGAPPRCMGPDTVAFPVEDVELCDGEPRVCDNQHPCSCAKCGDSPACRLDSCFLPANTLPTDCPDAQKIAALDTTITWLLLPRVTDLHAPQVATGQLPQLMLVSQNTDVAATPPEVQGSAFSVAQLGNPIMTSSADAGVISPSSCGGLSLCGIIPFGLFTSSPVNGWLFSSPTNLYFWSVPLLP